MSTTLASRLKNELSSRYSLIPSDQWLNAFLSTIHNTSQPLPALTSTAQFRLVLTDFTTSLSPVQRQVLTAGIQNREVKEQTLVTDVPVQVLDIQDTSTSKWSQIEAIERVERGEEIRGREVIRNVPGIVDEDSSTVTAATEDQSSSNTNTGPSSASNRSGNTARKGSTGPHKLLLQDAAGTKVWAFELSRIERITIVNQDPPLPGSAGVSSMIPRVVEGMQIGCKLLLKKGTKVRRGMVMLTLIQTTVIGGKVETWDQKWREGRKARLRQDLESESNG
ncbi:hypothetical protein LTR05_007115 [Lithohypha guttulata]|uniref:RecQ mediated genome instability protein 1-like N-terminal helical domain-containing protein n=1 Tax=Lithohypha guttulata TaxID=1690604 RepID=A0AAN7SUI5_9EURO|nr:hypothetical protein LTR05_007115 [Lithohypha guttulata]